MFRLHQKPVMCWCLARKTCSFWTISLGKNQIGLTYRVDCRDVIELNTMLCRFNGMNMYRFVDFTHRALL
jgi:hypothetical protein